jgi:hypothetical protein
MVSCRLRPIGLADSALSPPEAAVQDWLDFIQETGGPLFRTIWIEVVTVEGGKSLHVSRHSRHPRTPAESFEGSHELCPGTSVKMTHSAETPTAFRNAVAAAT